MVHNSIGQLARGFICILASIILNGMIAGAVDFDCMEVPSPIVSPPACAGVDWCVCWRTELSNLNCGEPAAFQQAQIYGFHNSFPKSLTFLVKGGTLDLSRLKSNDFIGQFHVDADRIFKPGDFVLDFQFVVTVESSQNSDPVRFDVRLLGVNDTTINLLGYDPLSPEFSSGLLGTGSLESLGTGKGFKLQYDLIVPQGQNPAIQLEDLITVNYNTPLLFTLFDPAVTGGKTPAFSLPRRDVALEVESRAVRLLEPQVEKTITEKFTLEGCPQLPLFKRGDADGSGVVDISDPINNLSFQFLGAFQPVCKEALDDDDSGVVDISDPIFSLTRQFLGGPIWPPPGPTACGTDDTPDGDDKGNPLDLDCNAYDNC